jgi:hypothetical protein
MTDAEKAELIEDLKSIIDAVENGRFRGIAFVAHYAVPTEEGDQAGTLRNFTVTEGDGNADAFLAQFDTLVAKVAEWAEGAEG